MTGQYESPWNNHPCRQEPVFLSRILPSILKIYPQPSVPVEVVDVGGVGVRVGQCGVLVLMAVRLVGLAVVGVGVVLVVEVAVLMAKRVVGVLVLMELPQNKPEPRRHKQGGADYPLGERLMQEYKSDNDPY